MKWGVRKTRQIKQGIKPAVKGIRNVSDISIRKLSSGKNYDKIANKYIKERRAVRKDLDNYLVEWYKKNPRRIPDKSDPTYTKTVEEYMINTKKVVDKYMDDFRGAYLKDMGVEDTEKGRRYLKKHGFL